MTLTNFFREQLEREVPISRRVLARVPEGRPDWKPHEKSMQLGYLATLAGTNDELLATLWRLLVAGRTVSESPRRVVIADTLCHAAHHRGQLTVYLRLLGVPVPSIYGPSADDRVF